VFAQLRAEHPDNIEYKVVRLDDGVSFVHVSSADTPDGSNPLPELAAFKEFGRDSASRVATPPVPVAACIIGSYCPAVPLTSAGPGDHPPSPAELRPACARQCRLTRRRQRPAWLPVPHRIGCSVTAVGLLARSPNSRRFGVGRVTTRPQPDFL
jgi:hypothetical protein